MDHIIAENKGTLSRDNQRNKTLISLYHRQKREEADRLKFAPKPSNPLKCTNLKDSKRYFNEDIMAVDKLLRQLTEESLMFRMEKYAKASSASTSKKQNKKKNNKKNKNEDDDGEMLLISDDDENELAQQKEDDANEKQTQYNSVRILNNKLHEALIQKDIWERRVSELELLSKEGDRVKTQEEAARIVASRFKNQVSPKNRRKGFFGAAKYLPESVQNANQLAAQKQHQQNQKNDSRRRQREHKNGDEDDDVDFIDLNQQDDNNDDEDDEETSSSDAKSEGGDSVDELLAGILPTNNKNNFTNNQTSKSGAAVIRKIPDLFSSHFDTVSDHGNIAKKNEKDVSLIDSIMSVFASFDGDHDSEEDSFFVDPATIPSEEEIQRKIVEDKKAKLRARLLAK